MGSEMCIRDSREREEGRGYPPDQLEDGDCRYCPVQHSKGGVQTSVYGTAVRPVVGVRRRGTPSFC